MRGIFLADMESAPTDSAKRFYLWYFIPALIVQAR